MPSSFAPVHLGDVLQDLIEALGIQHKLDDSRIVEAWKNLAGASINDVTDAVWVARGNLYVKISSSTWRHELYLHRFEWRDRVNDRVGARIIREIVFR